MLIQKFHPGSVNGVQQSDVDAQLANPAYSSPVDATTALAIPLYTVDVRHRARVGRLRRQHS